jgi:multidrug efflux pump subunit AcrB
MSVTKTGLVPQEDQGILYVNISTAPGSTLQQTKETVDRVEEAIKDIPQVEIYAKVTGFSQLSGQSSSAGVFFVRLKPWDERKGKENNIDAVTQEINRRTSHIKDAKVFIFSLPMVIGYGNASGVELHLQDRKGGEIADFAAVSQGFIAELNKHPEIRMAYTSFNTNYPQYMVDVDVAKCKQVGISPKTVLAVLSGYCGGQYVTDLNRFSKVYRVMMQAAPENRLDKQSLEQIYVRTSSGMAPITQFITLNRTYGAESLNRFNMFNSISVSVAVADSYSSGDAIGAIKEIAITALPTGYGYEFGGMTREESGTSNNMLMIFGICLIFIYLILCALYESFLVPLAVILSVPVGLMGSFLFTKIMGLENNIYLQMGVIMLIGLLAKTAILITEYAQQAHKRGTGIGQAALTAARERFRPILMTALTMIVGLLPLLFSTGVGANGNISLGVGAVGGMFIGTLALLFITPALFVVM